MPFPLLDLNTSFDFLSGAVALLVSFYSFRYTRLIENSTLRFLSFGFVVLGLGLLAEALLDTFAVLITSTGNYFILHHLLILESAAAYSFLQVAAYFVIMLGYVTAQHTSSPPASSSTGSTGTATTAGLALAPLFVVATGFQKYLDVIHFSREIIVTSAALSMAFLAAIVYQDAIRYKESRNKLALLVLVSFVLILVSQSLSFTSAIFLSTTLDMIGTAVQFAGFLSLLIFLLGRSKIGPAGKATQ